MTKHNHEARIKGHSAGSIFLHLCSIVLMVWFWVAVSQSSNFAFPIGVAWFAVNIAGAIVTHDNNKGCCK